MEITGIVLRIVTYGFRKSATVLLNPEITPKTIPRNADKTMDTKSLKIVSEIAVNEYLFKNILIIARKTWLGNGKMIGWSIIA